MPPYYDSFAGQAPRLRPDRPEALAIMRRALDELVIEGVQTTIPLHKKIFRHPDFISGNVDTTWARARPHIFPAWCEVVLKDDETSNLGHSAMVRLAPGGGP